MMQRREDNKSKLRYRREPNPTEPTSEALIHPAAPPHTIPYHLHYSITHPLSLDNSQPTTHLHFTFLLLHFPCHPPIIALPALLLHRPFSTDLRNHSSSIKHLNFHLTIKPKFQRYAAVHSNRRSLRSTLYDYP